ncbi:hypothetical protein ACHAWU_004086 [Discostella pseudostelligera]|uniref:Uncharacterized protein n=1 Tax=Discostella pseudostelligera TaxID=259834 RepID=A0ABD3MK19_9STRA
MTNASMWRMGPSAWLPLISLIVVAVKTRSFAPSPANGTGRTYLNGQHSQSYSYLGSNEGHSAAQKEREQVMEMSSIAGAEAISKLDLEERTKRAMLAEVVEDRIFELADQLELLIKQNNGLVDASDSIKEQVMEMAKETKNLQVQYDDLVNGRPSLLLDLDGIGNGQLN